MVSINELLSSTMLTRIQALIAEEPDAVVSILDADYRIVWADEASALEVYGRKQSDYTGQPAASFVDPARVPSFLAAVRAALAGDTSRFDGRARASDGTWRTTQNLMWPTVDGRHVVNISITSDLPEEP